MATSTEKETAPKSRKLRVVLFSLLAFGLAGTAGGTYYYLSNKHTPTEAVAKVEVPIFIALDPFTVNLQPNGRNRFLHVAITLKMTDPQTQGQVTQYLPEVRSRVLTVLSNREGTALATPEDKARLSAEIMAALNLP
ncbi:MAG: flagellar basal body-associated FliL family protein, partial [Polaromonas sp.]